MLTAICHCEAVRVTVPRRPSIVTGCNCSICLRYGVLQACCKASTVRVSGAGLHGCYRGRRRSTISAA
jgi:hypothetical protein